MPIKKTINPILTVFEKYSRQVIVNPYRYNRLVDNGLSIYLNSYESGSYPGSGNIWYDLSGNNFNGTLINSPNFSNNVFTFNGTNQYVDLGNPFTLSSSNHTVELMLKINVIANNKYAFTFRSTTFGSKVGIQINTNTSDSAFYHHFGETTYGSAKYVNSLNITNWVHVVGVRDGINSHIYINGVLGVAISTKSGDFSAVNKMIVAAGVEGSTNVLNYLNANFCVVRVYNGTSLSQADISQNYNFLKNKYNL